MSIATYAQILRQHAHERPRAPALTFAEQTWTFAQLHEGSSRVGQALRASGVQPGDRVALLTKNCAECFELIFACSKVGAILAGLNWRLSAREIATIVTDAAPTVLVVADEEEPLLKELPAQVLASLQIVRLGRHYQAWRAAASPQDPGYDGTPDEVADKIMALQEQTGEFGTLLYAGKDWTDPKLGRDSMILMAEQVMPRINSQMKNAAQ
jgi:long-chain acyl-CoA synthetase